MVLLKLIEFLVFAHMLRVCVNTLNNDESACTTGYNSEDNVFINLFSEDR